MPHSYPCSWCDAEAQVGDVGFDHWDLCQGCYEEFEFVRTHSCEEIREYYERICNGTDK